MVIMSKFIILSTEKKGENLQFVPKYTSKIQAKKFVWYKNSKNSYS